LLDSEGKLVENLPLDWDVRKWLPGKFNADAAVQLKTKPGAYELALGIRDPWTGRPGIAFLNDLSRRDGWTILSRVEVR
jgi:hypothetical protein